MYLGGLLRSHGRPPGELSRRLGEAGRVFEHLSAIWKHANISKKQNIHIFDACVTSKLLYSLESLWLLQDDRNKLDGFYAKCLRRLLGIPASYESRISNKTVLSRVGVACLSGRLLQRQLLMFGRLARQTDESLLRQITFEPASLTPRVWNYRRRVGRPRLQWIRACTLKRWR